MGDGSSRFLDALVPLDAVAMERRVACAAGPAVLTGEAPPLGVVAAEARLEGVQRSQGEDSGFGARGVPEVLLLSRTLRRMRTNARRGGERGYLCVLCAMCAGSRQVADPGPQVGGEAHRFPPRSQSGLTSN